MTRRGLRCAVLLGAFFMACGGDEWRATGVVDEVFPAEFQISVAHDDIEGLMPAMTMNFYVAPALLPRFEVGQQIEFTLRKRGNAFEITDMRVVGQGAGRSGTREPLAEADDPAAPWTLTDQTGAALSLEDLRGKAVLLDFIFTHCPGPCPILTGVKAELQRGLSPALAARTHFVSITLDPARDDPAALLAYAQARKLDLENWSFLTGPPEVIDATLRAYGVGRIPTEDGDIQHTVATFLIDAEGQIRERYLGSATGADELRAGLEAVL